MSQFGWSSRKLGLHLPQVAYFFSIIAVEHISKKRYLYVDTQKQTKKIDTVKLAGMKRFWNRAGVNLMETVS